MQEHKTFYPVKIQSRSIAKKRFRRVSWFVLGTSFGVGCAVMMSPAIAPSTWITASQPAPASFATTEPTAPEPSVNTALTMASSATETKPEAKLVAKSETNGKSQIYPVSLALKVENGDTLMNILTDTGVSYEEAQNAVDSIRTVYNPKKLDVGQNVAIVLDKNSGSSGTPIISSVTLPVSTTSTVEITRKNAEKNDFDVKKIVLPVERKLAHAGGKITSSLYETGMASGIPAGLLNDIITTYSYDVDFQRDIQPGDMMDVLYERMETKDGIAAGNGEVLFAELTLSGRVMKVFRYVDKAGNADYYNDKGESVRKALLRTPINGAKITSGFGMRSHPIMGYSKMHRGVDFGAPTGTPIYASGDGTVDYVGRKGGYGNYLRIKHNPKYGSAYAHISRFASGLRPGQKVKQGQIVAYVGTTGMSTGPHLHYEILVNNEQVNPSSVKFKAGNILQGKEMAAFKKNMEQIQAQLASTPRKTDLAIAKLKGKQRIDDGFFENTDLAMMDMRPIRLED